MLRLLRKPQWFGWLMCWDRGKSLSNASDPPGFTRYQGTTPPKRGISQRVYGCFLKCWYPPTIGFPTKNDHFGVFWGYHHLRKPLYAQPRQSTSQSEVGLKYIKNVPRKCQKWSTSSNPYHPCMAYLHKNQPNAGKIYQLYQRQWMVWVHPGRLTWNLKIAKI